MYTAVIFQVLNILVLVKRIASTLVFGVKSASAVGVKPMLGVRITSAPMVGVG